MVVTERRLSAASGCAESSVSRDVDVVSCRELWLRVVFGEADGRILMWWRWEWKWRMTTEGEYAKKMLAVELQKAPWLC